MDKKTKIAIIGLGYVGLPLMVEFAKKFAVVGFDINSTRIGNLKNQIDETMEVMSLQQSKIIYLLNQLH